MLKICLTIDCESYISFKQGNPEWNKYTKFKGKINNLIKNFRYNKNGFWVFYNEIKKQKFPCTFMLVGKIFKPVEDLKFVEWGYHTFDHIPLNLISNENIKKQVKNIYNVKSFTAPMWRVEDIRDPKKIFELLKKQGYKNTVYHGKCYKEKTFYKKQLKNPETRFGIKCFHVSNYFEGNWNKKKINNLKKHILKNLNKEAYYILTTHDFTHKNPKNLRTIINFLKKLHSQGKVEIMTLSGEKYNEKISES